MIHLRLNNNELYVEVCEEGVIWYAEAWCPVLDKWYECTFELKERPWIMRDIQARLEEWKVEQANKLSEAV